MASQITTDEDAQKRNTDCVYFLASPLTCKKGTDCEYRHSESARINPRDCWFWLNGNCLNPNCPFRHPPLDGKPGASSAPGILPVAPVPPTKRVPCFFFSQGFCAKGEKCAFMHGPQLVSNLEASSQKPVKPVIIRSTESKEKQIAGSKGNGPSCFKPVCELSQEEPTSVDKKAACQSEAQSFNVKSTQSTHESDAVQNVTTKVRATEGITSAGHARPSGHEALPLEEQPKQFLTGEERMCQIQPVEERFRQVQSGEDKVQQVSSTFHPRDDILQQVQSGEERMENDMESEDWWEESSPGFDVLVDGGPDQLFYPDDIEYLSHQELLVESGRSHGRGGLIPIDDLTEFEYDHLGAYDQSLYFDASSCQYDPGSYDPYEQQLGYDDLNPYDHLGSQHSLLYNDRAVGGMPVKDRHGIVSEKAIRDSAGSSDLRNRITKRRTLDSRTQRLDGDNHHPCSRHDIPVSDFQHGRRHQDDYRRQEHLIRPRASVQGSKPNYRRSRSKSESGGNKRARYDPFSEYLGGSPERISVKSSLNRRNIGNNARTTIQGTDHGWCVSQVATVPSENRSYTALKNRKAESRKDDSDFAGPKSLAQIKAEKRNTSCQESMKAKGALDSMPHSCVVRQKQIVPLESQISSAPVSSFHTAGDNKRVSVGRPILVNEPIKNLDFEGPKPLSAILEAKRKAGLEGEQRSVEIRKEQRLMNMTPRQVTGGVSASHLNSGSSFEKGSVNDEHRQEHNTVLASHQQQVNGIDLLTHFQNDVTEMSGKDAHVLCMLPSNRGDSRDEEVKCVLGTYGDMEVETEPGDNALEDEDFELDDDDDDDDDFAKKLGGFFS